MAPGIATRNKKLLYRGSWASLRTERSDATFGALDPISDATKEDECFTRADPGLEPDYAHWMVSASLTLTDRPYKASQLARSEEKIKQQLASTTSKLQDLDLERADLQKDGRKRPEEFSEEQNLRNRQRLKQVLCKSMCYMFECVTCCVVVLYRVVHCVLCSFWFHLD